MFIVLFLQARFFLATFLSFLPFSIAQSIKIDEQKVNIKGLSISYVRKGQGKVLLLLHGWGQSKHTWHALTTYLSNHFDVIALDLPNFGHSDYSSSVETVESYSNFVKEFMRILHIGPCFIAGHSFGGKIAIDFAIQYPDRVKKLIIIGSKIRLKNGKLPSQSLYSIYIGVFSKILECIFSFSKGILDHLQIRLAVLRKSQSFLLSEKMVQSYTVPVLLLYGDFDVIIDKQEILYLQTQLRNAQSITLRHTTHLAHEEKPEECSIYIKQFLTS